MSRQDIERLIAEALAEDGQPIGEDPAPQRPVAHGRHILDQYVKLCDEADTPRPEPSTEVELAVASPARAAGKDRRITLIVKAALARFKR